jgi:hypothetical protein
MCLIRSAIGAQVIGTDGAQGVAVAGEVELDGSQGAGSAGH